MASIRWLARGETFRIAACRNLQLAAWYHPPTLEQARKLTGSAEGLRGEHGSGIALLNMIPGGGLPDFSEDVRTELTRAVRSGIYDLGAAHVVLTPGLAGVAIRAFVSTILLLGKPKTPQRAFARCPEAAAWLLPLLVAADPTWRARELADAYEAVLAAGGEGGGVDARATRSR